MPAVEEVEQQLPALLSPALLAQETDIIFHDAVTLHPTNGMFDTNLDG